MAWIESHQTLREHPKTYALAELLGISKAQAIGHLHLLWWWCVDYAPDGVLTNNDSQIARAGEWTGDVKLFIESLITAGFIDRGNGVLTVHDWSNYTLHYALFQERKERQRKQAKNRAQRYRERNKQDEDNADETRYEKGCNAPVTQSNAPTVPTVPHQPNRTVPTEPDQRVRSVPQADARAPSLHHVQEFFIQHSYVNPDVEAEKFWNYYTANGWKIGKNAMKDWQAAAANWNKKAQEWSVPNGTTRKSNQRSTQTIERATFTHDEEKLKRLAAFEASLRLRDEQRRQRS